MNTKLNRLKLHRLYIDTQFEHIVYMSKESPVYKAEGFSSMSRVQVFVGKKSLIASLNIIDNGLLKDGQASLSENAWKKLGAREGSWVNFRHPPTIESMSLVRAKMYGKELSENDFRQILSDISKGYYSNVELSAFITACAGDRLSLGEITALTKAMVDSGKTLHWHEKIVADKHCVGGLPGNRTSPIVVAIVAAAGLKIPKTSSRAITSPAGTADTMETITRVELDMKNITRVVNDENGCLCWGGTVMLSPVDDILIRVERALDVDSTGQMICSVLSKKKAAGSTHVVIDIPVGKTAKVRTKEEAEKLEYFFKVVASAMKLQLRVLITDGSQPIGNGIGPALEALDVLSVLRNEADAPGDLKQRSLLIAAELLELTGKAKPGKGKTLAKTILEKGAAYQKFKNICLAQGAFKTPRLADYKKDVLAAKTGQVKEIDNRRLAKVAKLAGAPEEPGAGVCLAVKVGSRIKKGEVLYSIYSQAKGELHYALNYLKQQNNIITIG